MSTYVRKEQEIINKLQSKGCNFTRRDMFKRYCKKIDAYLKLVGRPLSEESKYFEKYTEDEFDTLIRQYYNIKGDITPQKILKAKLKTDKKELTEHEIQVEIVKYLSQNKIKYFAVPNGFVRGGSDRVENAKYVNYMKAEGLKNGAPDLVILPGNGDVIFLEVKTEKGKPSEYQLEWQDFFNLNQYTYKIVYGLKEAKIYIDKIKC